MKAGDKDKGKIMSEEERMRGGVPWSVYWAYLKACAVILAILVLLLHIIRTAINLYTDFWLAEWATSAKVLPNQAAANSSDTSVNSTDSNTNGNEVK